jgi:SAF domain-containing protein
VKNWMVALVALAMGGAVSATLLVFANSARGEVEVFAVASDLPAGTAITPDVLRLESVGISAGDPTLFTRRDESHLDGMRAAHDLHAGQLLQRGDVVAASAITDERLVFLPVKDAPPATPGSKLDLLYVSGTADAPSVVPFALGVEVRAVVAGGFVVVVPSSKAAAFVYAAEVMRLVAVVAEPGAASGAESPIDAPDQALAVAAQP